MVEEMGRRKEKILLDPRVARSSGQKKFANHHDLNYLIDHSKQAP
jgi:hypothetical protein